MTLNFKNYSKKEANYQNWIAAITTDADRWASGYAEYIILRADNAGWGTRWVASNLSSNYNWETFMNDMDGSDVEMTVTRNGALVTVHADITASDGETKYYENFYTACGSGTQDIRVFLSVDHSHITNITSDIVDNGNSSDSEGWGVENAHIDFTNAIVSNSVAGETNSITGTNTSSRWVKGFNDIDALNNIIRIGSVAGTVTIPDEQLAGAKDEVIISFDIWYGKFGKTVYFQLWDNAATPVKFADFERDFYNGSTSSNTFGLDVSKITSIGSSSAQDDKICTDANKTTFNIHLNYLTGKMYIVQYTNGGWQQTTSEVAIGSENPLKRLVIGSNYNNEPRRCWLDNIFIYTKKGDYNTTANVTLSFKDNEDNDISALYTGISAFTPEKGSTFKPSDYYPTVVYDDDYKYTYTSGGDDFVVSSDTEVELVYTKSARPTYTYNVTANYGAKSKKIVDGVSVKETADYTYYYPRFILDGTTLYEYTSSTDGNASAKYWTSTHTNVSANATYTLTYNAIEGECVYFSEGEDVSGAVEYRYSGFRTAMSNGSTGYLNAANLTSLDAGVYSITARAVGRAGDRYVDVYKNSVSDENKVFHLVAANAGSEATSQFSLTTSTDIVASAGYNTSTENGAGCDYIYIMKLPDNVSGTITPAGWSTFASPYALDLSTITGGTAYYASAASGSKVTMTSTTVTVPAGEGLLIKGTAGETFTIDVAASGTAIDGNLLKGQTTTGTVDASNKGDNGKYHYVFGYVTETPSTYGFYNLASDTEVAAGKAYLETATALTAGARISIVFEDETTGISLTENSELRTENAVYDLQGRRVAQPQKGLYIVNGKKVVIK